MRKKHDEGYALIFVLVVMVVLSLISISLMTAALRNLQNQQAAVVQMEAKYEAQGKVEKVVVPKESKGVFYPMSKRPEDKRFLANFAWFDYVRPLSKEDIFIWRGKGSDKELKVVRKNKIPLPTFDQLKK